jgi:methionine-rich copper-binding protein CopC
MLRAAAAAALVVGSLAVAAPASAHAGLDRSEPAGGTTVTAVPGQVRLDFTEDADPNGTLVRVDGAGGPVSTGKPVIDGAAVTQALQPGLTNGEYTVKWRYRSIDGHETAGTFTFVVDAPVVATPTEQATASAAPAGTPSATAPGVSPTAEAVPDDAAFAAAEPKEAPSEWPVVAALAATVALAGGIWWWRTLRPRRSWNSWRSWKSRPTGIP